jgi:hypothetical protein
VARQTLAHSTRRTWTNSHSRSLSAVRGGCARTVGGGCVLPATALAAKDTAGDGAVGGDTGGGTPGVAAGAGRGAPVGDMEMRCDVRRGAVRTGARAQGRRTAGLDQGQAGAVGTNALRERNPGRVRPPSRGCGQAARADAPQPAVKQTAHGSGDSGSRATVACANKSGPFAGGAICRCSVAMGQHVT